MWAAKARAGSSMSMREKAWGGACGSGTARMRRSSSHAMPESTNRPSPPSRKVWEATPRWAQAAATSPARTRASSSRSGVVRWAAGATTSPISPRVAVTTCTSAREARRASSPPAPRVSSSGWAKSPRTTGRSVAPVCCATFSSLPARLPALGPARRLGPLVLVEDDLADAHGGGGDLHALVLAGEFEGFLEAELHRGGELFEGVGGGRAHVRELLFPGDVDVHVLAPGVLPDHLPLIHLGGGVDEEGPAVLELQQRVGGGHPGAVGDEGAAGAQVDGAHPWGVALGDGRGDAGAAGVGQELGAEPDEAPGGDDEL